jgi:pimeloyl-ACP methyl ester carboxylesterase
MTRYLFGTSDRAIPPSLEEFMARRAHSHITEVDAGHLVMLSHPVRSRE